RLGGPLMFHVKHLAACRPADTKRPCAQAAPLSRPARERLVCFEGEREAPLRRYRAPLVAVEPRPPWRGAPAPALPCPRWTSWGRVGSPPASALAARSRRARRGASPLARCTRRT